MDFIFVFVASAYTTTTTTVSTASSVIVSAYWTFDNTAVDSYGVYNGQLINGAGYTLSNSTSQPYFGNGQALNLVSSSNQLFLVSASFFNLSYTSFTIEAWIYPTVLRGDHGIFGQCSCSSCSNQCLYLIIRNSILYVDFTSNYLSGSTVLSNYTWYHVAFVYNYGAGQQILYVNGVQDAIKSNSQPYLGQNASISIGSTQVSSTTNYFNGYIDNLLLTTQAKGSTQILSDGSLTAYYSFDSPNPASDNGPNGLNGVSSNTFTTTGRVNQAMGFYGGSSYFQVYGFYQLPYGVTSGKPFSIALWINPLSVSTSTIIQLFGTALSSSQCENLLGIYASGSSAGQIYVHSSSGGPSFITGPFVTQNTWTHISLTYSSSNGYSLYVNGVFYGATGTVSEGSSGAFAYFYIGFYTTCYLSSASARYGGSVDEVYIYSRELSRTDVTQLANP